MENKFVDGLFVNDRGKAPEFVKAKLSFLADRFIPYLEANANAKGYVYVDILESKEGKLYAKINDFKKEEIMVKKDGKIMVEEVMEEGEEINVPNDLPF